MNSNDFSKDLVGDINYDIGALSPEVVSSKTQLPNLTPNIKDRNGQSPMSTAPMNSEKYMALGHKDLFDLKIESKQQVVETVSTTPNQDGNNVMPSQNNTSTHLEMSDSKSVITSPIKESNNILLEPLQGEYKVNESSLSPLKVKNA